MTQARTTAVVAALASLLAAAPASAQVIQLTANLTNAQENPPAVPTTSTGAPRPASFGTATFVLDQALLTMTFEATIFNIDVTGSQSADVNDNLLAAHIHAGPNLPGGPNNPVVWGFFGTPFNDNNPNDFSFTPFVTGVGGTFRGKWDAPEGNATTLAAQIPNILAGRSYINFHTTQFGGGEIRGQLQVVPEPSTYLLMASGLAGLGLVSWRRRRTR